MVLPCGKCRHHDVAGDDPPAEPGTVYTLRRSKRSLSQFNFCVVPLLSPTSPDMRTSLLRRFITTLGLLTTLTAPLTALDSNESNLTLLDTESPAIRDLAVVAKDYDIDPITKEPTAELVYDKLNTRNKIGVFFSENTMDKVLGRDRLNLQLLKH